MTKLIFQVLWDIPHAAGSFAETFGTEEAAEAFGRNWVVEMCAVDGDDPDADDCPYQFEVIEVEPPVAA